MKKTILLLAHACLLPLLLQGQKPRLVMPIGHTGRTQCAVFSPNGNYVLTGSIDFSAKLWDLNGKELQYFNTEEWVYSAVFSPPCPDDPAGGKYVLLGSGDHTVTLWNMEGEKVKTFVGHTNQVNSVAFSPDGKFILSGGRDNFVQLWDLDSNKIQQFIGHSHEVTSVAFSPDGKSVLTGSRDGRAILWDLDGNPIQTFQDAISSQIFSVAFSPACPADPIGGKNILTGHPDAAQSWDLAGNPVQRFIGHKNWVRSVAFSPDGQSVLTGSYDSTAVLWDLAGNAIRTFRGNEGAVFSVAFSPACRADPKGGKYILTCDETAKQWDLAGNLVKSYAGHASPINFVAFDPEDKKARANGNYILTSGWGGKVCRWNIADRSIHTFKTARDPNYAPFASDGKSVLTMNKGNSATRWDYTGKAIQSFNGHSGEVRALAFSPDGKSVLSGSNDKTAKLWDLKGNCTQTFSGHTESIESIAFSPDGKFVLTGTRDSTAILWDLQGNPIRTFNCENWVEHVAFLPAEGGKSILTVSDGNMLTWWDSAGNVISSFRYPTEYVMDIAFSPANADILIGGYEGDVTLYDADGEVRSFEGYGLLRNRSVNFSPDGKFILSGGDDNVTKLWDVASVQELATLVSIDSTDWVVTTPSGLFDASPGAMQLMHYMVGLEVIELEQLNERYWQPGLLGTLLGFNKHTLKDVGVFSELALFPSIKESTRIESNSLQIQLQERNGGMGKLSFFINGKRMEEDINPQRRKELSVDLSAYTRHYRSDTLNTIELVAYEAKDYLKSQPYKLYFQPSAKKRGDGSVEAEEKVANCNSPRHLYLIMVGTSLYPPGVDSLPYANDDAAEMARVLSATGKLLYENRVHLKLLSTEAGGDPSKTNIASAFKAYADSASVCDVLVVFFAGHGSNWGRDGDKSNFYYLTKDIAFGNLNDEGARKAFAISDQELTEWMTHIPAQNQLLILDACNSGKAAENVGGIVARDIDPDKIVAFQLMNGNTGSFIISGSSASGASFESDVYGHGLLTYSLLEGISGNTLDGTKVDVLPLLLKAYKRVEELAKSIGEEQTPIIAKPRGNASFFVGKNDGSVKIELKQAKPMVIRSSLFDKDKFNDALGLTDAVNNAFRSKEVKGKQSEWFYSDTPQNPNGFSIRGSYTLNKDGTITVRGSLLKGEEPVGDTFEVTDSKDPKVLAATIIKAVRARIKVDK